MELNQLKDTLSKKQNGSFVSILWQRDMEVYKQFKGQYNVKKVVKSTIRKGITGENTKYGKARLEARRFEDAKVEREPWCHYEEGYEKIILRHNKTDVPYLKVFTSPNMPKVQYFVNNNPISKDELYKMGILTANERKSEIEGDSFLIKVENIIKIF